MSKSKDTKLSLQVLRAADSDGVVARSLGLDRKVDMQLNHVFFDEQIVGGDGKIAGIATRNVKEHYEQLADNL